MYEYVGVYGVAVQLEVLTACAAPAKPMAAMAATAPLAAIRRVFFLRVMATPFTSG